MLQQSIKLTMRIIYMIQLFSSVQLINRLANIIYINVEISFKEVLNVFQ